MKLLSSLNKLARLAAQRTDIVIAALMLMAIAMMIIPLPTVMVDLLIGINFAFSILILVVAFYITNPVEFSSLPSVILLSTLFRLSLSITTTRLILLQADAGQIVMAFGDFVVGGEVVIGLVIFLIITIAQFVVITKGSERVAEVGARFALDAMPGKQMSIDNEARSGEIDQAEAKRRRQYLEQESQFYGAMDGAMKFVKGDAIAGLIIIGINLIGGLAIGILRHGMPFADAAHTYSLLTVGDGLIAQIPALMTAIAAGTVVTRVSSESGTDLGSEVVGQLAANSRALALASAILFGCGLIPGFPLLIFWFLAAVVGGIAYIAYRNNKKAIDEEQGTKTPIEIGDITKSDAPADDDSLFALPATQRLILKLSNSLSEITSDNSFQAEIVHMRGQVYREMGVRVPVIGIKTDNALDTSRFSLVFDGVPIFDGTIWLDQLLVLSDKTSLELLQLKFVARPSQVDRREELWVDAKHEEALTEAGIIFHDTHSVILRTLQQVLRRYLSEFVDTQEARHLLSQAEEENEDLVKEALAIAPLQKMSDVLRRLVSEDIPIVNLRAILRTVVEWGPQIQSPVLLAEYARLGLARQICHRYSESNRVISAYLFTRSVEETIRIAIPQNGGGSIPEDVSKPIVEQLRAKTKLADPDFIGTLLVPSDIRRNVRHLLMRNDINIPVLAYEEISPEFSVQSLGYIAPPNFNSVQQAIASRESEKA